MHKWLIPVVTGLALCAGAAQAQGQGQKMPPQQGKATLCEQAAVGKKGSERQAFLNSCMAAQSVSSQSVAPRTDLRPMKASGCEHGSATDL